MEQEPVESKRQIIERIRYDIQNKRKVWSLDERGKDNYFVKTELERCDILEKNIEVVAARYVASMAYSFKENCRNFSPEKIYMNGKNSYSMSLFNNNEDAKRLVSEFVKNYTKGDEKLEDEFVQRIYEAFGFEGKLPTRKQLKELKRTTEDERIPEAEREKAERKLQLAERKLGMQYGRNCNVFEMTYEDVIKEKEQANIVDL